MREAKTKKRRPRRWSEGEVKLLKKLFPRGRAREILGEPSVEYIDKWMCCETLRLHPWWTRLANAYWEAYEEAEGEGFDYDPFEFAVGGVDDDEPYGIVKAWLEWLGYEEIR